MLSNEESYILGLWCADGYRRTSSIGLSNIHASLIQRFAKYLRGRFDESRLRLRVYIPECLKGLIPPSNFGVKHVSVLQVTKAKHPSYHIYVNSRPLLREFDRKRKELLQLREEQILPYFAGRFDGDGSVNQDGRTDFRIVYCNAMEAETDKLLLKKVRPDYRVRIYQYKTARTYCLYISRYHSKNLIQDLISYSTILQDRFLTP